MSITLTQANLAAVIRFYDSEYFFVPPRRYVLRRVHAQIGRLRSEGWLSAEQLAEKALDLVSKQDVTMVLQLIEANASIAAGAYSCWDPQSRKRILLIDPADITREAWSGNLERSIPRNFRLDSADKTQSQKKLNAYIKTAVWRTANRLAAKEFEERIDNSGAVLETVPDDLQHRTGILAEAIEYIDFASDCGMMELLEKLMIRAKITNVSDQAILKLRLQNRALTTDEIGKQFKITGSAVRHRLRGLERKLNLAARDGNG